MHLQLPLEVGEISVGLISGHLHLLTDPGINLHVHSMVHNITVQYIHSIYILDNMYMVHIIPEHLQCIFLLQ